LESAQRLALRSLVATIADTGRYRMFEGLLQDVEGSAEGVTTSERLNLEMRGCALHAFR
jgi:hypothetical protein